MASFCCYFSLAFTLYAILSQLTLTGELWIGISLLFIAIGVFGFVFALHDYRLRSSKYNLFLIAGNAIIIIFYLLNIVVYM